MDSQGSLGVQSGSGGLVICGMQLSGGTKEREVLGGVSAWSGECIWLRRLNTYTGVADQPQE